MYINERIKGQTSSFLIILFLIIPVFIYAQPSLASTNASINDTGAAQPTNQSLTPSDTSIIISSVFQGSLPIAFIVVIFLAIVIPLVLDMYLAYKTKPKDNARVLGIPGLYRSLMAFGIIILLGTVVFYLLALITLNLDNTINPIISSLVDLLANLGTILGTALATIIAFYFGIRGTESAVERAAAVISGRPDRIPPSVRSTSPSNGDVPVDSLVQATFSETMNSSTINESTFLVKRSQDDSTISGKLTLSPDDKTASFDSDKDFSPNTKYVATVNTGVRDLAGNALVAPVTWSFITRSDTAGAGAQQKEEQSPGLIKKGAAGAGAQQKEEQSPGLIKKGAAGASAQQKEEQSPV